MIQASLFDAPRPESRPSAESVILRDYQRAAVNGVFDAWKVHRSTLVCLPTGTGKSVVFSAVMKRWVDEKS